jgi:hypothetical protein
MIGPTEYVKLHIRQAGLIAGKRIALRLASCGAVIRPHRSLPLSQLVEGGLHPPFAIPCKWGVPAPAPAGATQHRGLAPIPRMGRVPPPSPLKRACRPFALPNRADWMRP